MILTITSSPQIGLSSSSTVCNIASTTNVSPENIGVSGMKSIAVSTGTISVVAVSSASLYNSLSSIVATMLTGPTTNCSCGTVMFRSPFSSVTFESVTSLSSLNFITTVTS